MRLSSAESLLHSLMIPSLGKSCLFWLPLLAAVTLRQRTGKTGLVFQRREGVCCGNSHIFYSVLTNQICFYPVPSDAL